MIMMSSKVVHSHYMLWHPAWGGIKLHREIWDILGAEQEIDLETSSYFFDCNFFDGSFTLSTKEYCNKTLACTENTLYTLAGGLLPHLKKAKQKSQLLLNVDIPNAITLFASLPLLQTNKKMSKQEMQHEQDATVL